MSKIDPEVMREIDEEASLARAVKKQSSLENGASLAKASSDGQSAYNSLRQRKANEFIKSLGFKSFNDLRMNQYSQLRRDGNHVRAGQAAQILSATPETVYPEVEMSLPVAADVEQGYAARVMSAGPEQASRLLPENEYSDADIAELLIGYGEQPTADAAFNREYAEMLMKEQGY